MSHQTEAIEIRTDVNKWRVAIAFGGESLIVGAGAGVGRSNSTETETLIP